MKQPWRSHYNAICGDWVAKHNRTTRNGVGNCSSKTGPRRQSEKKTILKHFLKGFLEGKSLAPKTHFVRDFLQNSIGNSSTSTTCNPIYIVGTILQLQITMEFCRPRMHEKTLETPFTMRNRSDHGPRMIRPWSENDPTTHETVSHPSHRRGRSSTFGDALCLEKHRVSCICYLSKTHFVRDFLQNSIGKLIHQHHLQSHLHCGNDPTVANHNGILSTAHARKNTWNPIYNAEPIRDRSDHDPRMIRPDTRPSRNRRTAEVDHRGSETDFVWKNIGFRASAISQKRISCETSFKTPSATPPPAPLAIPFTVREQFLWLTRSLTNSFFANSFFALSLTTSYILTNSFFDQLFPSLTLSLTFPSLTLSLTKLFPWLTVSLTNSFFD